MLSQIGIFSDNFYKFLTSLSLIICLYCTSFDILFIRPHDALMEERNMQLARLSAEAGYLRGVSNDLTQLIEDSIKYGKDAYWYTGPQDTSIKIFYYSTADLDVKTKELADSLNLINWKLASANFQTTSLESAIHSSENQILYQYWISLIIEIISFIVFIFGLFKWYRFRKSIDKNSG